MIEMKRVYEAAGPRDGYRVLVDRLWPRGVSKAAAKLDEWVKSIAPSDELRHWYNHDPAKWEEFQRRYAKELEHPDAQQILDSLARRARRGRVTLLYSARDEEHNNAVVVQGLIQKELARNRPRSTTPAHREHASR